MKIQSDQIAEPKFRNTKQALAFLQALIGVPLLFIFALTRRQKIWGNPILYLKRVDVCIIGKIQKRKKIKAKDARDNPSLIKPENIFILDHGAGRGHTGIVKRIEGGRLIIIEGNSNPNGSSNGIGVFELNIRKVWTSNLKGYCITHKNKGCAT